MTQQAKTTNLRETLTIAAGAAVLAVVGSAFVSGLMGKASIIAGQFNNANFETRQAPCSLNKPPLETIQCLGRETFSIYR